jgi:hypothetical protein
VRALAVGSSAVGSSAVRGPIGGRGPLSVRPTRTAGAALAPRRR